MGVRARVASRSGMRRFMWWGGFGRKCGDLSSADVGDWERRTSNVQLRMLNGLVEGEESAAGR